MKLVIKLSLVAVLLTLMLFLSVSARAADDGQGDESTAFEDIAAALPESAGDYLAGNAQKEPSAIQAALRKLLGKVPELISGFFKGSLAGGALMVGSAALLSMFETVDIDGRQKGIINLAGTCAICAAMAGRSFGLISAGINTAGELADWSVLVLPAMTTAAASAGAVSSAAAKYAAASVGIAAMSKLITATVLPLVYAYIAVSVGAAAFGQTALKSAAKLIRRVASWILTISSGVFLIFLVLSGATAVSVDAVAAKSVKTALNALPIVGGITSDAASAVLAGAGLVRNAAGLLGILAIGAICVEPLLSLLVELVVYKVSAALAGCFSTGSVGAFIDDIGAAFGISLAACGLIALMLFFSIVSLMQTVAV